MSNTQVIKITDGTYPQVYMYRYTENYSRPESEAARELGILQPAGEMIRSSDIDHSGREPGPVILETK